MKAVFDFIIFSLSLIGALASGWYIIDRTFPIHRLSWRKAQKAAQRIKDKLIGDDYSPTLIVGIGRGGAIFGAMLSGCLGHRPLLVIDRKYIWSKGRRMDEMILKIRLPGEMIEKILLVAGEAHSGNTIRMYYDDFIKIGAKEVRRTVFYCQVGCTEAVEYIGIRSSKDLRMPWMFTKQYLRQSRSHEEAEGLLGIETTIEKK